MSFSLGPFTLTGPLGRGAAAEVYRGVHASGLEVAVKVLTHEDAASPELVRSFRNEVRAVARLDHPNVVQLFELGVVSPREAKAFKGRFQTGAPWLAMQLCPDGTLTKHRGALPWAHLKRLLLQLLDALGHAHANGLVHRDVKPGNLMLDGDDLVLTDFGLAEGLLEPGAAKPSAGTPAYMSPEQLRGEWRSFGVETDLYAVGAAAYTLIAGEPPFGRGLGPAVSGHLEQPVPPLPVEPATGVDRWIACLMAKERRGRPPSAAHAAAMLLDLGETHTTVILPDEWARPKTEERTELIYAGLGLYALRPPPLIGRVAHRTRLWELLGEAVEGRTRCVVLRGPAGVGKSRLAAWLCARAHELGGLRAGRAFHSPTPGPRQGLPGLVRRQLAAEGLEGQALAQLGGEQLLADWLDGRTRLRPAERYGVVQRALSELVVTWLDDVQWGPDALGYSRWYLQRRIPGLLVLTVRDGPIPKRAEALLEDLIAQPETVLVEVGPLDAEESAALVQGLLGLDPTLAEQLQARAGGIPLFAVELVGDWVQRGLLERGPDGWLLSISEPDLPSDLYGIWRGALERILGGRPPDDMQALEIGAVLGAGSELDEWQDACQIRGLSPSDDLIEVLIQANLTAPDEGALTFVHGMLRESLVLAARRGKRLAGHHGACADALGGRLGAGIDARYAEHLVKAGRPEEALVPTMIAVRACRAQGDLERAVELLRLYEEALTAADIPPQDARWGNLARERSRQALVRGATQVEERSNLALLEQARTHGWRVHEVFALRELGTVYAKRGRHEEGIALMNEALDIALELDDEREAARCWWNLGLALQRRGDLTQAGEVLARAVRFSRVCGDTLCEAGSQLALADVFCQSGRLDASENASREALGLFAREHVLHGEGGSYNSLGEVARQRGDLDRAEMRYRQARQRFHAACSTDEHVAELNLGQTCAMLGRHGEALEWFEASSAGLSRATWTYLESSIGALKLPSLVALGRYEEARGSLVSAREALARTGFAHLDCVQAGNLAALFAREGGEDELADALSMFATEHEESLR
ncbi:MAG TPA: tetratricopeptide repeat protein [Myxococcota bacterium]|nr:tetratricopeptide repeat protein [Myxococcota bacterium]